MSAFKGYLLKAVATNQIFPDKYVALESWTSTPNQREEIKAYRDDNSRALTRITAQGTKSKWSFTTRPRLHLSDKIAIQEFFTRAEASGGNSQERKVLLEYWNEESNTYEQGYFYRPDIEFTIYKITDDDILYKEMKITGVEY